MVSGFPWVDLLFLVIILYTLLMGFLKGFFKEIISIAFFVIGLFVALSYWRDLSSIIRPILGIEILCDILSFSLILISFMILGSFTAFIVKKLFIRGPIKFFDRIAGLVFGGIKGIFIVLVLIIISIAFLPNLRLIEKSTLAFYSLDITDSLAKIFPSEIYNKYKENLDKFITGGDNGKRI
jgi:membrane protein required for colicin V production